MTELKVRRENVVVVVKPNGTESSEPYLDLFVDVVCVQEFDGHIETMTFANPTKELWDIAKKNTLDRIKKFGLNSFIFGGNDDGEIEVVTNKLNYKGAGAILFPEVFKDFCDRKGIASCYIVPSSVHELLLVPTEMCRPDEINETIRMVNRTKVDVEDRLADHAYIYNANTNEVRSC